VKRTLKSILPAWLIHRLRFPGTLWPPVFWGSFRRTTPISTVFGLDRGLPVDRYYIEAFLQKFQADIRGRVLEIGDDTYTARFGKGRVTQSDVLHVTAGNPKATLVGDLETGEGLPADAFDCMILTQTLPFIFGVDEALAHACGALKPGGTLLVTVPGISQISRYDMDRWGDYWRFTSLSLKRLLQRHFPADHITVNVYGNVLAAVAFLQGLAAQELHPAELNASSPDYEVIIGVRAVKPATLPSDPVV
jgi:hypothetical protein